MSTLLCKHFLCQNPVTLNVAWINWLTLTIDLQDGNKELGRLQQQLASPTHIKITHHHEAATTTHPKVEPKEVSAMLCNMTG